MLFFFPGRPAKNSSVTVGLISHDGRSLPGKPNEFVLLVPECEGRRAKDVYFAGPE